MRAKRASEQNTMRAAYFCDQKGTCSIHQHGPTLIPRGGHTHCGESPKPPAHCPPGAPPQGCQSDLRDTSRCELHRASDSRHPLRQTHHRNGFGIAFFMPRVRTRTPMERIFSARSRIRSAKQPRSQSAPCPSRPQSGHNIFSAPAGPSVVMMCITLIMFVLIFRSESSPMLTSQFFFGRNHRPRTAPHIPGLGMVQHPRGCLLDRRDHSPTPNVRSLFRGPVIPAEEELAGQHR